MGMESPQPHPAAVSEQPPSINTPLPNTKPSVDIVTPAIPGADSSASLPIDSTHPPASAEKIPDTSLQSAHTQVLGWLGEVDPNASPEDLLDKINRGREARKEPPLTLKETLNTILFAQHQERTNRVSAAKANLETATNAKQIEEPPEETRAQIKDRIDDAWEKGMDLLVQESITNVWNENAPGITPEDKLIRVTARRFKSHITAVKEYTKQKADEENKARLNSKPLKPVLTGAEEAEFRNKVSHDLRANPAQLKTKHYMFDATKGKYICYGTDGKTVTDEFAPTELVAPLLSGLRDLAGQNRADGKPTPHATDAQNSLQVLDKYRQGDGIYARTESELQAELAHKEIFDTAYKAIAYYLGEDVAKALVDAKTNKYDFKKIEAAIKENPNMALADLATTVYIYNHGGAINNPAIQGNIDASLFYQLQGISAGLKGKNPELTAQIENLKTHEGSMEKRFKNAKIIVQDFLIREKITVDDKNILRILSLSTFFEGQTELTQAHGLQLKAEARDIVLKLRQNGILTESDEQAITHLAHDKTGSGLFNTLYGVDIKSLLKGKTVGAISTFVIDQLIAQNPALAAQRPIYLQTLAAHMEATGLKRLNMDMGILGNASGPLIILALFAGALQDMLGTGVSTEEERR